MKPQQKSLLSLALLASLLGHAQPTLAADWRPAGVFVEGGVAEEGSSAVTLGAVWPWAWKKDWWGGQLSVETEAFISSWRARSIGGGHEGYTLVGVQPLLRYRFSEGRSPWFVEGGIGLSVLDSHYTPPHKTMSTRFNFYDSLGVGRHFGGAGKHEVSLRYTHISNADIKKPNPGEDFVQLRYLVRF